MPDSFVCNVGDMLERLTAGRYVSALHRVRNVSTQDRISMPLFLDPELRRGADADRSSCA